MRNRYKFYADIGGDTIEFPVNPKEYTISYPTDHKTYNVLDIGEIIVPRMPSLMEVSWESYFPGDTNDPLIMGHDWMDPAEYVELITESRDNKEICDLVISRWDASGGKMFDTNISALISDFKATERAGKLETYITKSHLKSIGIMAQSKLPYPGQRCRSRPL